MASGRILIQDVLRPAYWSTRRSVLRFVRTLPYYPTPARAFAKLPYSTLSSVLAEGPLIVLAPHPDDESLGCGGLIAACCAEGRVVHVVVLTDGSASHRATPECPPQRLAELRAKEAIGATSALGVPPTHVHFLGASDGVAPHAGPDFARLAQRLVELVQSTGAGTLMTSWRHDPHCDHVAAALLAEEVARLASVRLLAYPVWGWFRGDLPKPVHGWRIDITMHRPAKQKAIAAHASQITGMINGASRGASLTPNFLAAFARDYEVILNT